MPVENQDIREEMEKKEKKEKSSSEDKVGGADALAGKGAHDFGKQGNNYGKEKKEGGDEPAAGGDEEFFDFGKKKKKKGKEEKPVPVVFNDAKAAVEKLAAKEPLEAQAEPPKEVAVDAKTLANRKKKEKKKAAKGGVGSGDEEDDFEAALREFKDEAKKDAPEPADETKTEVVVEAPKVTADDEVLDAKTLANRKKKEKKRANAAVGCEGICSDAHGDKRGAVGDVEDGKGDKGAVTAPKVAESTKGGKAKAAPKKENAVVRAARERLEMDARLEAERRAFEEAERARIAEEERLERDAREREEAEREQRRRARLAKIERQKADGTYMTRAQKGKSARARMLREQFGLSVEGGLGAKGEAGQTETQKRPMAQKLKRKKPRDKVEEPTEDAAETFDPPPRDEEQKEAAPKEDKKEVEEDDDGWEKAAGEAEKDDEEDSEKGSDDESESVSGSDSDSSGSKGSSSDDSDPGLRSPIVVIMGHVDTGKTKLLDKIRRTNVQEAEAGGITQQIGATFFPDTALQEQTKKVDADFDLEVPGIMVIDTPGHESFNNLRKRGSSLCDLAVVVIDITHGLQPQTVESLELLKRRKCPFVIALNKIDKCFQWNSGTYTTAREALDRQDQLVRDEFRHRYDKVVLRLNELGHNVALYWENDDYSRNVSIVPTSALTGEGVPDLLYMLTYIPQTLMTSELKIKEDLECTVIEVKTIEGLGTTVDVILTNGTLREGDRIVLAGMSGPIVTTIRALLTPQPMKEMRVKSEYVHHAMINQSMGIKICAPGLEEAVAGTELRVVGPDDDVEEMKVNVDGEFDSILNGFEKQAEGVLVKASTLGSLEALLSFLQQKKIPVFDVGIGEVSKKDVNKAMIMKGKRHPEYAVILCFDVTVNNEATRQAAMDGARIFTADTIYRLVDNFTAYMENIRESKKIEARAQAVFPVLLEIDGNRVFHKTNPMVFACTVVEGQLRLGTPICIPEKGNLGIGRVSGIEKDRDRPMQTARKGDQVCVKIEQNTTQNRIAYGRHFDATNRLCSAISRSSIDALQEFFEDEMTKEDLGLIAGLKKVLKIR